MNTKIAMGFHTCVDYELIWDTKVVEERIRAFDIKAAELSTDIKADSERAVWILSLAYLKAGIGWEIIPENNSICLDFAGRFDYNITMGGTATRAAIALDSIGYESILQTSCYNRHVTELMPKGIHVVPGTEFQTENIYPHVILQCLKGVHICANDIDFIVPRENRIMISRDEDSLYLSVLDKEFGALIKQSEVFLLGSYTQILDFDILADRIKKTQNLLENLGDDATVIMEDGGYINIDYRHFVHRELAPYIDILSMNEDELQHYVGKKIDLLDAEQVAEAIKFVQTQTGVKNVIIHTSMWGLAYGEGAQRLKASVEGGIYLAASRFRVGDALTKADYEVTTTLDDNTNGALFAKQIGELLGDKVACVPCKDLSGVEHPTVVGLGDYFAGGLLPGLLI